MKNRIELIGHLGQDPESRNLENGTHVCRYTLATSESWKDANGEWQKRTTWHNIISWKSAADYASKHLRKGNLVRIEGRMTYRDFEDKNRQKRTIAEVVTTDILKLEKSERKGGFDKISERNEQIDFLRGNTTQKTSFPTEWKDSEGFIDPKS